MTDRETLERKLDSMRPGAPGGAEPLADEEITDVMVLAVQRIELAQRETTDVLRSATARLVAETERTRELTRALSVPPGVPAGDSSGSGSER